MRRMIPAGPLAKRPPHNRFTERFAGLLTSLATVAVVLLPVLAAGTAAADEQIKLGQFIPATPPQPAPEASFTDAKGKKVSLADFAGEPTLVNLWATWCQPCLKEMPSLDRLQAELGSRLRVAAVSQDHSGAATVDPFVAKMQLSHLTVYLDPQATLEQAFHVRGLPTSILLDRQGRVVGEVEGPAEWDSPNMLAVLVPFLKPAEEPLTHAANEPVNPAAAPTLR